MPSVTDKTLADSQRECQDGMEKKLEKKVDFKVYALSYASVIVLIIASFTFTWNAFSSSAGRATISEDKSSELRLDVNRGELKAQNTALLLADIKTSIIGMQANLAAMDKALTALEARERATKGEAAP